MTRRTIGVLALFAASTCLLMCNVFTSLENCTTDQDCTTQEMCEPTVKRCVPRGERDASPVIDAPVETSVTRDADAGVPCDTLPWGPLTLVPGLESTPIAGARLNPDETSMVLTVGDALGVNTTLQTASRKSFGDSFHLDGPIPVVNPVGASTFWPTMTADGLLLFFESDRTTEKNDAGTYDHCCPRIWTASRVNKLQDFSEPRLQSLFDLPSPAFESSPYVHPGGRSMYFASSARGSVGGLDLFVATIGDLGNVSEIHNIRNVNTSTFELAPMVSYDERYLYHARYLETEGVVRTHIFVSHRKDTNEDFPASTFSFDLNASNLKASDDYPSWVSPDHCRIYVASSRRTDNEPDAGDAPPLRLWFASRKP